MITTSDSYNYDLYQSKPEDSTKAQRLPHTTMGIMDKIPASLSSKKPPTTTKDSKRGSKKPAHTGKSAMASVMSNSTTRSLPSSPALNAVASPNPAFSASQQMFEKNKSQRIALVHELAPRDQSYKHLIGVWKGAESDLKPALERIGSFDASTKKWSLRKMFWKELDVWNYDYANPDDRQAAIDNAVRLYDKSRMPTSAPEWERLLPPADRGKGIILSKLQATLAKGNITPVSRGPAQKPDENKSDADSSKVKGEAMARSNSQPVGNKTKKVSEREAQTKRLLSTTNKKPAPKKPAPKAKATDDKGRKFLSEEKVIDSESSGDERPLSSTSSSVSRPRIFEVPTAVEKKLEKRAEKVIEKVIEKPKEKPKEKPIAVPKPKPVVRAPRAPAKAPVPGPQKRAREEDDSSSSSGAPLSKRIKPKELAKPVVSSAAPKHRPSDASQSSRNTGAGTSSSNFSMKSKNTSPAKSSPLASSPPTNASDFEDEQPARRTIKPQVRSGERITNGATTDGSSARGMVGESRKRKDRDAELQSSQQSTPNKKPRVPQTVLVKAKRFERYYERYESLHHELSALKEPPAEKLADLLDMRERLVAIKTEIAQAVAAN